MKNIINSTIELAKQRELTNDEIKILKKQRVLYQLYKEELEDFEEI